MATYTEHYNLKKPSASDYVSVDDLNGNADIIDEELHNAAQAAAGAYVKPSTGIPKADLAEDVQSSLDKADTAIQATEKGTANGVATLDGTGKVPSSQLPSYVDDVIEGYYYNGAFYADSAHTQQITAETGKIYVDLETDKSYRYSGSAYYRIDDITVDAALSGSSTNPVQNKVISAALDGKAPVIYDTASGAVASFPDGADGMPIKSLVVNIEPVQAGSGDPSPENIRPISGWTGCNVTRTGKNLLPVTLGQLKLSNTRGSWDDNSYTDRGVTYTIETDDFDRILAITVNGTAAGMSLLFLFANLTFQQNTILTGCPAGSLGESNYQLDINGGVYPDRGNGVTIPANTLISSARIRIANQYTANNLVFHPMLRFASVADSAFEPFADIYFITFPSEAGTVYGGTLDVVTGELTVDRGYKRYVGDASEGWAVRSYSGYYRYNVLAPESVFPLSIVRTDGVAANWLRTASTGDRNYTISLIQRAGFSNGVFDVLLPLDDRFSNVTSLMEYLAEKPLDTIYPLAQPITYHFTPQEVNTILGTNNIWADCGPVTVEYPADTKLYIDARVNATRAMLAGVEADMTASRAYATGDLLIVGDTLYKAAAPIASGAALTPGTNVNATTVAEQLLLLFNS